MMLGEVRRREMEMGGAFYALPPTRKTSAEIIREARTALHMDEQRPLGMARMGVTRAGVRTVNTNRPFTPREKERTLFGYREPRDKRPPSSFTLSPLHFDSNDANGGRPRLLPVLATAEGSEAPGSARRVQRHQFRATQSLCDLPEESEEPDDNGVSRNSKRSVSTSRSMTINSVHPNQSPSISEEVHDLTSSRSFIELIQEHDVEISDLESSFKLKKEFNVHNNNLINKHRYSLRKQTSLLQPKLTPTKDKPILSQLELPTKTLVNGELSMLGITASPLSDITKKSNTDCPPVTPEAPQIPLNKDDVLSGRTLDDATFFSRGFNKRPGIERNWRHAVDATTKDLREEKEVRNVELRTNKHENQIPEEPIDQNLYFEEKVNPILDEINRAVSVGVDNGVIAEIVDKLYNSLEAGALLGRHFKYRTQVLKVIFKLVDREHGKLLANVARLMMALKVSGSNLTSVCKLVFKVTRHDANDVYFMEGNLLELLLEAVAFAAPLDTPDACLYGYGALKFLTTNSQLVSRLIHRGVLELLVLHMKLIIHHKESEGSIPSTTGYALVQLTGTLRHVSSCERAFPLLLATGAVQQVCHLLRTFHDDFEVTANVVRILSIVSTQEECCAAAASEPGTLESIVKGLQAHEDKPAVVVRLAYALGNMLANSDEARWELFNVPDFVEMLLSLLKVYLRRDREEETEDLLDPLSPASGSPEDVIIKLIRVLANVSVHPKVGPVLSRSKSCMTILVSLVNRKAVDNNEELLLSALATLNNLTFYTRESKPSTLHTQLAESLCDSLPMEHIEGLVETIRVFGNLTHSQEVREILTQKQVLEVLIEMLDCDNRELVFVCAGVLVNMMSDPLRRRVFQQENGVQRMIDVLQYYGYGDWQLCNLGCQVLWNYCASSDDIGDALGEKEANRLICVLEEFLDDDSYFNNPEVLGSPDFDTRELIYSLWEDFAIVATKLLDRIEVNQIDNEVDVETTD